MTKEGMWCEETIFFFFQKALKNGASLVLKKYTQRNEFWLFIKHLLQKMKVFTLRESWLFAWFTVNYKDQMVLQMQLCSNGNISNV